MTGIAKRRAFAKRLCDEGCIKVQGRPAKAGRIVQVGDEIELNLRDRRDVYRVVELPQKSYNKQRANECFEIITGPGENHDPAKTT